MRTVLEGISQMEVFFPNHSSTIPIVNTFCKFCTKERLYYCL